jgi:hypothetical protein
MNTFAGYMTVPNTSALVASSASAATTTVTQTVTKAILATAHASFYAVVKHANGSASSLASAVPLHLMNQAADLFERAPKGTFTKLSPLLAALKCGLGLMIVFGIGAAMKRFPVENVPPGEDPRTWRQKATFAYNFLKNPAEDNEQLRRSIREAQEEIETERKAKREDAKIQKMTIDKLRLGLKNERAEHRKDKDVQKTIQEAVDLDRKVPIELRSKVQSLEKQFKEANDRVDITQEVESDPQGDMMMAEAEVDGLKSQVG